MNTVEFVAKPSDFINRELSWLEFNQRVLNEACRESTPLLDRLKFLAISASNLDEFFKVRVGGLRILLRSASEKQDFAGMTPLAQLDAIEKRVREMYDKQYDILLNQIEPLLAEKSIVRSKHEDIDADYDAFLTQRFEENLVAVIAPMSISEELDDPQSEPAFPLFVNAAFCICVRLDGNQGLLSRSSESKGLEPTAHDQSGPDSQFKILSVPKSVERFITVPSKEGFRYVTVELAIAKYIQNFFPGRKVLECIPFRITRNADMTLNEDGAADLLMGMTELLVERAAGECVRLEIADEASADTEAFLMNKLEVTSHAVIRCRGPLALSDFMDIATMSGFGHLRATDWPPLLSPEFPVSTSIFEVIAEQDRILFHPYESYDPVVEMIQEAATDPQVIAIKQTLYRTSRNSEIVKALKTAASNDKHVTAIVELKARFDEKRNIKWARELEQAGIDVIYGVRGLKTHAKVCIIVRREPQGIRRYIHFATGNYNESTSRQYSDISYFTCDEQLGDEAVNIFNAITGLSVPRPTVQLSFAPVDLRRRLEELIEVEIAYARKKLPAKIEAKVNSLSDQRLISLLYQASQAGVTINLNVRGICCLRPGVPGLSDRIRVVSIIDRFLEHSRILYFHHGGQHQTFISSADWMSRNLDRRVELLVPINHKPSRDRILRALSGYFLDNVNSYELNSDGSYVRLEPGKDPVYRSQKSLYESSQALHAALHRQRAAMFEPHKPESE